MTLWRLIVKEIQHRKVNVILSLFAVAIAAAGLIGSMILLRAFDLRTEAMVSAKEAEVHRQMAAMEDEFRKITKRMGFNVLILPKDQNLGDFYAENYADKTMPEAYARTLAHARGIVTIRHLLPMLQAKIIWPEQKRRILVIGVQGEMAWAHRDNKKPIREPVPPGTVAVGYELHQSLGLEKGGSLTLMGRTFRIQALHPERGSIDDITLWIDLEQAQKLFNKQGLISALMALECKCAWADLATVRKEIQEVLPETQVVELAGKALARAETRREAKRNAQVMVQREKETRAALRSERAALIAILVPIVIGASALLVGVLAFLNVRERRIEIGTLRALGLRKNQILVIFLGKALLLGILGAAVGVMLALLGAPLLSELPSGAQQISTLVDPRVLVLVMVLSPLVTVLASWVPALLATQQDPAVILREE